MNGEHGGSAMSRREALLRGTAAATALWVVPVVQVLGMSPASADQPSGAGATASVAGANHATHADNGKRTRRRPHAGR